jgi:hypothetical protein
MRIWSLHPKYLDSKGLIALWREALLAKHVLEGKTKGYKNHPQLERFKKAKAPINAINQYLKEIYIEASLRNYNFDKKKINWSFTPSKLTVTKGQLDYEAKHLSNKLHNRDFSKYNEFQLIKTFETHPLFEVIEGEIESWEILTNNKKSK